MGKPPEYQPYLFSPDIAKPAPPQGDVFTGEQQPLFSAADTTEQREAVTLTEMTVILAPPNKREIKKKVYWSCVVATERDDTSLYILRATGKTEEEALTQRLRPGDIISAAGVVIATDSEQLQGITYQTTTVQLHEVHLVKRADATGKLINKRRR